MVQPVVYPRREAGEGAFRQTAVTEVTLPRAAARTRMLLLACAGVVLLGALLFTLMR
jgi:hypothetical protein